MGPSGSVDGPSAADTDDVQRPHGGVGHLHRQALPDPQQSQAAPVERGAVEGQQDPVVPQHAA